MLFKEIWILQKGGGLDPRKDQAVHVWLRDGINQYMSGSLRVYLVADAELAV